MSTPSTIVYPKAIKGFVSIQSLIDNSEDAVAKLGEISTWSLTYSKNTNEFTHSSYPAYRLTTMFCYDTSTQATYVPGQAEAEEIIEVVNSVYNYVTSHSRPYDVEDLQDIIVAAYYGKISDFVMGGIVDSGTVALPEYVSWTSLTNSNLEVTVWLCDNSFQSQYPHYEITVVPPVDNLDNFFSSFSTISALLNKVTLSVVTEKIQNAKGTDPETYIRTYSFKYTSPITPADSMDTAWSVLIYGMQGDNPDTIKDAMIEYILGNSSHSRSAWEAIIPDLFKRTEFILLPRWDKSAVPNNTVESGLYSSVLNPKECISFAKEQCSFYETTHTEDHILVAPHPYKTLSMLIVAGPNNITGKTDFTKLFADYLPISSTSLDFNRMVDYTREWLLKLDDMLVVAETLTEISTVPTTFRKVKRDNKLYLSLLYDNVNYLMASGNNY